MPWEVRGTCVYKKGGGKVACHGSVEKARAQVRALYANVSEAETGKPGINFKQVGPDERKKLSGLMRYYAKKPHPFTACVRDNRKRFGDRAEKVCAVLKDLIRGTTGWRKGGRKVTESDLAWLVEESVYAAIERLDRIEEIFGDGASIELSDSTPTGEDELLDRIIAVAAVDRALVEAWTEPEGRAEVLGEAEAAFLAPLAG